MTPRTTPPGRTQRGSVLFIALILLIGVTVLTSAAISSSTMGLRMVRNLESSSDNFQTALAAVDFILADSSNLPSTGPLGVPATVSLSGAPFAVSTGDTITAEATRVEDCAPPPRMRNATSMKAYSSFSYELSAEVEKSSSGMGNTGMVQGYILLGPSC